MKIQIFKRKLKFQILKLETYEPENESKTYVLSVRSKKPQEGEFKVSGKIEKSNTSD